MHVCIRAGKDKNMAIFSPGQGGALDKYLTFLMFTLIHRSRLRLVLGIDFKDSQNKTSYDILSIGSYIRPESHFC